MRSSRCLLDSRVRLFPAASTKESRDMRILYVSEVQWLSQVSRKHHMVRRFPDDWETLFLSPANTAPGENSFITRADEHRPNVRYRSLPLPKPDSGLPPFRAMTPLLAATGARAVLSAARAFRPDVAVVSYIWAAPLVPRFREMAVPVVYDCNDLHTDFYPHCPEAAESVFRQLVRSADEVVASSERLHEICGRGVVIGNGVDLATFRGRAEMSLPERISASPLAGCRDFVIYVGSVDERVDFGILEELLRTLTSDSRGAGLLCVGRVFESVRARCESLAGEHPGTVLFTGRVAYEELPSYMSRASVGIAPFLINERTAAINPNKLYMYAAMDENVVSTRFSREIERHADLIYLADTPRSFSDAVIEALGDDDRRRAVRDRIGVPNSWDEKAAAFRSVLTGLVSSEGDA